MNDIDYPKPIRRDVHKRRGAWAKGNGYWEYSIIEREYEKMLFIHGNCPENSDWVMQDILVGMVHHYITEGWIPVSINDKSAIFRKD